MFSPAEHTRSMPTCISPLIELKLNVLETSPSHCAESEDASTSRRRRRGVCEELRGTTRTRIATGKPVLLVMGFPPTSFREKVRFGGGWPGSKLWLTAPAAMEIIAKGGPEEFKKNTELKNVGSLSF